MGFILAIAVMLLACLFAWANQGNLVTFHVFPPGMAGRLGIDAVDVPVWAIILVSALITAIVSGIINWLGRRALGRRLNDKELELRETKDRLRRVEGSLQEYEGRIHDFTLKVLELARSATTAGQLEATIGEVESAREALGEGKKEG